MTMGFLFGKKSASDIAWEKAYHQTPIRKEDSRKRKQQMKKLRSEYYENYKSGKEIPKGKTDKRYNKPLSPMAQWGWDATINGMVEDNGGRPGRRKLKPR
jgi:hypothetical protein